MEENYCVYKHTSPSGKVYIGITRQSVEIRWQKGIGYKKNPHFWNAIQKYGWENFSHEVLETGLSKEIAEKEERRLIKHYSATDPLYGYNMTFGGETGAKFTQEVKDKISKKLIEYFKDDLAREKISARQIGRKHSKETRQKMSESQRARMTDEVREKMRILSTGRKYPNRIGHPQTEETKKKISEAKRGIHCGGIGRKPRPVMCVDTGVVYESAIKASSETGVGYANIYRVCNGKRGKAGGYKWQYANEYNSSSETA